MMEAKRTFDLIASCLGFLILSPLIASIAFAIFIEDGGSPFFRQIRIGRYGRPFSMIKLRTMVHDAQQRGGVLTVGDDPRITRIGGWIRRYKIDELPQLLNVLKGEMSLVGPRPEVPYYVNQYTPSQQKVLYLIPGITDPASIAYRHESQLLNESSDPEKIYVNVIMPRKNEINLAYAQSATLATDIRTIFHTLSHIIDWGLSRPQDLDLGLTPIIDIRYEAPVVGSSGDYDVRRR